MQATMMKTFGASLRKAVPTQGKVGTMLQLPQPRGSYKSNRATKPGLGAADPGFLPLVLVSSVEDFSPTVGSDQTVLLLLQGTRQVTRASVEWYGPGKQSRLSWSSSLGAGSCMP